MGGVRPRRTRALACALVLVGALFGGTACGGAETREEKPAEPTAAPETPREAFTIYRDELDRTLQRGLQPLIAEVNLRPVHEDGRFLGWRLQFLQPGQSPYRESAVRPGDVLVRVNDQPLERPDQMMALWKSLETADRITFAVVRGGRPMDITYRVVPRP